MIEALLRYFHFHKESRNCHKHLWPHTIAKHYLHFNRRNDDNSIARLFSLLISHDESWAAVLDNRDLKFGISVCDAHFFECVF